MSGWSNVVWENYRVALTAAQDGTGKVFRTSLVVRSTGLARAIQQVLNDAQWPVSRLQIIRISASMAPPGGTV